MEDGPDADFRLLAATFPETGYLGYLSQQRFHLYFETFHSRLLSRRAAL